MGQVQGKSAAEVVAKALWESACVTIKSQPSFTWASGLRSPIYTDNRLLLSHPKQRDVVVKALLQRLRRERVKMDVIAGVATSGIPMAAILADRLKKPLVYVRPEAKAHGRQRQVEGAFNKGAHVILIEDLVSTGGSSLKAAQALRQAGAKLTHIFCTFAYAPERLAQRAVGADLESSPTFLHLTDADTLLRVGRRLKFIGPRQEQAARSFLDKL